MSDIQDIITTLETKTAALDAFGKKIKLDLDGNLLLIDGTTTPPSIVSDYQGDDADVSAAATVDVFGQIINKKMNVQMAMMSGKIKVSGNMVAAVPLMQLL